MIKHALRLGIGMLSAGLFLGCQGTGQSEGNSTAPAHPAADAANAPVHAALAAAEDKGKEAVAEIHGAGDNRDKIHGKATFTQIDSGVKIVVDVEGLTPGKHGIHIHEKPDLSDPKLMSTGGHYNPDDGDHKHAGPDDPKRHAGDLGNIEADASGHGHLELTDDALSVDGKNAVVGHALIIHEKEDDLHTQQPPGNAGGRIAGGAIVLATQSEK